MLAAPQFIAQKGESIYKEKFQQKYEKEYLGKFVAIDIDSEQAFVADSPVEAIEQVQKANPTGYFHLIKVGSPGVYRVGYTSEPHGDWLFR